MSQIDKLIRRFYATPIPKDITVDELVKLAEHFGCKIISGGNHPIKIVYLPTGTVIPIPYHGNTVKIAYIKEVKELIDRIQNGGN